MAKKKVRGDITCDIVCPNGPPPTCPREACTRALRAFARDMTPEKKPKKKKKGLKGGQPWI